MAAYNNLGLILQQTGDWKGAVRMFESGIKVIFEYLDLLGHVVCWLKLFSSQAEPKGDDVFAAFYNIGNAYNAQESCNASFDFDCDSFVYSETYFLSFPINIFLMGGTSPCCRKL